MYLLNSKGIYASLAYTVVDILIGLNETERLRELSEHVYINLDDYEDFRWDLREVKKKHLILMTLNWKN